MQTETVKQRRDFWDLWIVRIVVVAAVAISVVTVAVVADPAPESWQAKTWELVHHVAVASVGHR